ncbi:MAG: hypothetical protein KDB26_08440 [Microthrixaceae bacterium]|nr:hypothetical protein [Microthrixaceae bacterium]
MIRLHQEHLNVIVCPGDVVTLDYRAPVSLWSDGRLVETIGRDHSQPDQDAASDQQRETEPHSAVPGSSEPDRWPDEIDVFVLTDQRDHVHVQAFIDRFVDVDKSQYRGLERLQVLPTGRTEEDSLQLNDWEWVPVRTLDEIIDFGLGHPHRAFRVDLDARAPIADASLTFTTDSKVYFGLSLDDMEDPASSMAFAHKLLNRLLFVIDGAEGWIVEDGVAPLDSGQPMPFNGAYVTAHRRRVDPPLET